MFSIPSLSQRSLAALLPACTLALAACAPMSSIDSASAAPAPVNLSARAELKAFPQALEGHRRYVIELPVQPDESRHRVELYGSKTMQVDCNTRHMDGQFEKLTVQGWGYDYWVLRTRQQVLTTMMACPPGSERPGRVQTASSELLRYNSKLPLVVFVPEGLELGYRIWNAGEAQQAPER